jgi:hypothetical protein
MINIWRDKTSADDFLERANYSHLEYYQATEFALRRLFQPTEQQQAASYTISFVNQILRSNEDNSNILMQLRADIIHSPCIDDNNDSIVPGPWTTSNDVPDGTRISNKLNPNQKIIWNVADDYFDKMTKTLSLVDPWRTGHWQIIPCQIHSRKRHRAQLHHYLHRSNWHRSQ